VTPDPIRVEFLADHPQAQGSVVRWLHNQWFHDFGYSLGNTTEMIRARLNRVRLPLALIALAGSQPIGTVSLIEDQPPDETGPIGCLAGLYVLPHWRGHGIGTRLCRRVVREARRLHLPAICLYTKETEAFYVRLGWRKVTDCLMTTGGELDVCTFMQLEMTGPTRTDSSICGYPMGDAPAGEALAIACASRKTL
jgi:predicted N-acetyltransferase YhbS